jgi:peptide/nickel transport system permease protein
MIWYAARIVAGGVVALIAAAIIIYFCLELPLDLAGHAADPGATAGKFATWLIALFTGNLGVSPSASGPIGVIVAGRLAVTLPLIGLGLLVAALSGGALGYGATRRARTLDRGVSAISTLFAAVPNFWLGMLFVIVFAVTLHWLPPGGFVPWTSSLLLALQSLILPALTLGLPVGAMLALRVRDAIVAAQAAPSIRAAQMRGMKTAEAFRAHGIRHVVLAVLDAAAPAAMSLAAGSVIVETVFYLPGLGRLMLDGAAARDVAVVSSAALVLMSISVVLFAALRLAAGWLDPRISQWAAA